MTPAAAVIASALGIRPSEAGVICALFEGDGAYVSWHELISRARITASTNAVKVMISNIRRKKGPGWIETQKPDGYRLTPHAMSECRKAFRMAAWEFDKLAPDTRKTVIFVDSRPHWVDPEIAAHFKTLEASVANIAERAAKYAAQLRDQKEAA